MGPYSEPTELNRVDAVIGRFHRFLFIRHRIPVVLVAFIAYIGVFLAFGRRLNVSANYFALLPVLTVALAWGMIPGLTIGAIGLPMNLLLFAVIGDIGAGPENKLIAELFGTIIGGALGYLSDYYYRLERENLRRREIENQLRAMLSDRELLLQELNHRVKNNLSVIKSIIQLQNNRSANPEFHEEAANLLRRIMSLSMVHEQLVGQGGNLRLDPHDYLKSLVRNILNGFSDIPIRFEYRKEGEEFLIRMETAAHLGLITNEIITNTCKHAFPGVVDPLIVVSLTVKDDAMLLIQDNGPGMPESGRSGGLGLRLVASLSSYLRGSWKYSNDNGARFELRFPLESLGNISGIDHEPDSQD